VGTCIGRCNYQPYLAFIYGASATCILLITLSVIRLGKLTRENTFGYALKKEWSAACTIVYSFFALVFVGTLSVFHTYLLSTNQTTYEYFRHRSTSGVNPFDRRLFHNCHEAFCGATGLYRFNRDCEPENVGFTTIQSTGSSNLVLPFGRVDGGVAGVAYQLSNGDGRMHGRLTSVNTSVSGDDGGTTARTIDGDRSRGISTHAHLNGS
jgi:hypothetical protein